MIDLKSCPFCGHNILEYPKIAEVYRTYTEIYPLPSSGGCFNQDCPLFECAINVVIWNTRPLEDALRAEIERLQKENDELLEKIEYYKDISYYDM